MRYNLLKLLQLLQLLLQTRAKLEEEGGHVPVTQFVLFAFQHLTSMRLCGVVPPTPEAVYIVRNILRDPHVGPLTTKGIYYRALQVKPETLGLPKTPATKSQPEQGKKPDIIPYPYHPIRSKSYLKDTVLYFLERRREIEKIHVFRKATPKERSRMLQALREKKPSANVSDVPENIDQWMWRPRGLIRRSGSRIGGEEDSNAM